MSNEESTNPIRPMLSNQSYDAIKWLVQTAMPLAGALYFGIAQIWGAPGGEEVVGTLAILATFLGSILGVSNKRYKNSGAGFDGEVHITVDSDGKKTFSLNLDDDPENLSNKGSVSFKVVD